MVHGSPLLSGRSFKNSWAAEDLAQMRTAAAAAAKTADHSLSFIMATEPQPAECLFMIWP